MHQAVRARIEGNAEYHSAMAEHFAGLKDKKEKEGNGNGSRERATLADTHEIAAHPTGGVSLDDLTRLVEMHEGAAQQLRALLDTDKPQAILKARDKPPVVRKGSTGMPMRIGSPRVH